MMLNLPITDHPSADENAKNQIEYNTLLIVRSYHAKHRTLEQTVADFHDNLAQCETTQ